MSSFQSQPDVRASDCSWSGLASFVTHSREMAGEPPCQDRPHDWLLANPSPSRQLGCEGEERRMDPLHFQSHTNCFQPRGDREDRTVQTNGPKDALILFRANLLSRSWQACSKYASSRASQHAGDSSRFPQDTER